MKKAYGLNGRSKRRFVKQFMSKRDIERIEKSRAYKQKYKKRKDLVASADKLLGVVERFEALKSSVRESKSNINKLKVEIRKMDALLYRYERTTMYDTDKEKLREYIRKLKKAQGEEAYKVHAGSEELMGLEDGILKFNHRVHMLIAEMKRHIECEGELKNNEKYRIRMIDSIDRLKKVIDYCK